MFSLLHRYVNVFAYVICLTLISLACHQPVTVTQLHAAIPIRQESNSALMPSDSGSVVYGGLKHRKAVYRFYDSRHFKMAWQRDGLNALTDSIIFFIESARWYGLLPQDYHLPRIETLRILPSEDKVLQHNDALLTDAFLSIASDLKFGRSNPESFSDTLLLSILENALADKKIIRTLQLQESSHRGYQLLKKALREILNGASPVDRELLLSGKTNDSIPLHHTIQQIEINMERWRSETSPLRDRYIWINIPSYQLQVIDSERVVLESRTIVGKPETPSPMITSLVDCIILYPYWHVPRKIAVEEFLPQIQKDTSFLRLNNFEIIGRKGNILNPADLEWEKYNLNYFPLSLRQREGPENSLGVVKFVFDNPYAVFLHDTNAKKLFRKKMRALSHGCIRMEKAVDLAKYLVQNPDRIGKQLALKEKLTISLSDPIPIYIRYFTCEFVNGTLNFYDDIYGQDQQFVDLLYHRPEPVAF